MFSSLRGIFDAFRALVIGVFRYFFARGTRMQKEEYCHVCQARDKPLQLGRYMIRPGSRHGALVRDPLPDIEIFVCNRHHPDSNLDGAVWAKETLDFLGELGVAIQCIYLHHHHRQ